jgi:hypothetical protein
MTVTSLDAALDIIDEIGSGAVGCGYRRRTGQTLYAVFVDESKNDLDIAPDVTGYIPIDRSLKGRRCAIGD